MPLKHEFNLYFYKNKNVQHKDMDEWQQHIEGLWFENKDDINLTTIIMGKLQKYPLSQLI